MNVLVVKTSSMGDVLHTFPAVTDACRAMPDLHIDWVVEEAFADIPRWHPGVETVIPVAIRRWRTELRSAWHRRELQQFNALLRLKRYDVIIDAQGLIKSAVIASCAKGTRYGLDRRSAREGIVSLAYHRSIAVPNELHAITRVRRLFAQSLNYALDESTLSYGLESVVLPTRVHTNSEPYLVFLHGASWDTKLWPTEYWQALAAEARRHGYRVLLPWGCDSERATAMAIARREANCTVLPSLTLDELAAVLSNAHGVVGLDSGLCHMASALAVPTVSIFGPTDPGLTGVMGTKTANLPVDRRCAPCFKKQCTELRKGSKFSPCFSTVTPETVWTSLVGMMPVGVAVTTVQLESASAL